ncbi:MAG: 23S rRNA methyltransferase A, partial [[Clostridium] innocuum]|nr:23S rRNA methyltransferase A [[Clostridium] innocuum]
MLLCPKCGNKLVREERVWRCQNNHSYDIAKRGYVNLALHHKALSGDDREMVKARTRFLSHGYYAPLQAALVELVRGYHPSVVIDAGCGEGYYTNRVKQETDTLLGFDLSKY